MQLRSIKIMNSLDQKKIMNNVRVWAMYLLLTIAIIMKICITGEQTPILLQNGLLNYNIFLI